MTAYGAVISLENTIDHILHSSRLCLGYPSREIIYLAYKELQPLRDILKRLDSTRKSRSRKKVNALDGRIKETIWKFEDSLESLLSDQIISQFQIPLELRKILYEESPTPPSSSTSEEEVEEEEEGEESRRNEGERDALLFFISVLQLQDAVDSFIHTLEDMQKEYIYELENMAEDDYDESISSRSTGGFDGILTSKMIGISDQIEEVKYEIMRNTLNFHTIHFLALVGMAGVGKTSVAKEIYEDAEVLSHFECQAWVTIGRIYETNKVVGDILAQVDPNMYMYGNTGGGDDEHISECLRERLDGKKCLIVLDDVWEGEVVHSLMTSSFFRKIVKEDAEVTNGSLIIRILVTARDRIVFNCFTFYARGRCMVVPLMKERESKDLLCHKVFGEEEICPPQLDEAATKIANKCEGLPLLILIVADILSRDHNRDPRYWEEVAEERNSVFTDAHNEISKVLFPSYDYLSQNLKMFFLYMGVFPPDYDIPLSELINTLTGEGWFKSQLGSREYYALKSLEELCVYSNLVLFKKKMSDNIMDCEFERRMPMTFHLHPSWRHLCKREASKNKFFHVLNRLVDGLEEHMKGQRSLCLQNNILFAIKEFRNRVRRCLSSTRSLLFFGPYHQYPIPIPIGVNFKLLGELDALQLRFYTFPTEILTLVLLKYLALTCNGDLPPTISKLFNLRVLIIHPHMAIRSCDGVPYASYIPIQIWDMMELEHIEIMGKNLLAPNHVAPLEKVSRLVRVNANIGIIFRKIPRIRKLGVQIELTPCDDLSDILSCFGHISTLESLETLKCSVLNPVFRSGYVVPVTPAASLMFPRVLKKLHLSGMGFPWEYMDVIGSLPNLEVLKLKSYAFRGPKWETKEISFMKLELLVIEDSDLVQWKRCSLSFLRLRYLSLKHCYKLRELHWQETAGFFDGKIELVNCNPLAVACARNIAFDDVTAYSSF